MDYADKSYLRRPWWARMLDTVGQVVAELIADDRAKPMHPVTRRVIRNILRSPENLRNLRHGVQLRSESGLLYVEPVAEPQSLYEITFDRGRLTPANAPRSLGMNW